MKNKWQVIGIIILLILSIPAFKDIKSSYNKWRDDQQYHNTIQPNNVLLKKSELNKNPQFNDDEWLISKAVCAEYENDIPTALNYLYQIKNPTDKVKKYIYELKQKLQQNN